jgi:hypothetical protein
MLSDRNTRNRERRLALILVVGLGAFPGAIFGLYEAAHIGPLGMYWDREMMYNVLGVHMHVDIAYWKTIMGWAGVGAVLGGALMYFRQLLRT